MFIAQLEQGKPVHLGDYSTDLAQTIRAPATATSFAFYTALKLSMEKWCILPVYDDEFDRRAHISFALCKE
ncbi:MAG TPA: hypothetical protein VK638_53090 [Edaphobacter sp.]|nr:hypothetical protein [Edaphobacter sp.]